LKEDAAKVSLTDALPVPSVPAAMPGQLLEKWRISPLSADKPNPAATIAENDVNSWSQVKPPTKEGVSKTGWVQWRSEKFKPFKELLRQGGVIRFREIDGKGEIWLDGIKVLDKSVATPQPVEIALPSGNRDHQLVVMLQKEGDSKQIGLGGVVTVEAK
jgi:beta-galactosidase